MMSVPRRSNIQDHFRQPAIGNLLDTQAVIGDRLDLVLQAMTVTVERFTPGLGGEAVAADVYFKFPQQQALGVEVVQQLLEPVEEQVISFRARNRNLDLPL